MDEKHTFEDEDAFAGDGDEGGWETVVDPRKERRREKAGQRKAEEDARRSAARAASVGYVGGGSGGSGGSGDAAAPARSHAEGLRSAPQVSKRHKSKKKENPFKKPTSDDEMVALIRRVLESETVPQVDVPTIGNRVVALTGASWSKGFKSRFGTIQDFVNKRPEFRLRGDTVTLVGAATAEDVYRAAVERVEREEGEKKKAEQKKKQQKTGDGVRQRKPSGKAPSTASTSSSRPAAKGGEGAAVSGGVAGALARLFLVVVLLASSVFLVLLVINRGDVDEVLRLVGASR